MHECIFKSTNNDYLFARTLDFSFELEPEFVYFPRYYPLSLGIDNITNSDHYAFMGLDKNIGSYQMADGINEHGLAAAALYFEGYASYADEAIDGTIGIAAEQLVQLVLAQCKSIRDIKALFKNYTILSTKLDFIGTVLPLHWSFHDIHGDKAVLEITHIGTHFCENELGVLANSPDYIWHETNVRNYISLDPNQVSPKTLFGQEFKAFGQGSGTFGLPGDSTSPSRFIRTLYNKLSAKGVDTKEELLIQGVHILNNLDIEESKSLGAIYL